MGLKWIWVFQTERAQQLCGVPHQYMRQPQILWGTDCKDRFPDAERGCHREGCFPEAGKFRSTLHLGETKQNGTKPPDHKLLMMKEEKPRAGEQQQDWIPPGRGTFPSSGRMGGSSYYWGTGIRRRWSLSAFIKCKAKVKSPQDQKALILMGIYNTVKYAE